VSAQPTTETTTEIPKIIWMMWMQGLEGAPYLVRRCYDSWRHHNPSWRVIFLDETNLHEYVDVAAVLASDNAIEVQARSDIIRVNLLAEHGGVWVDATCFCCRPLDSWLGEHARGGFFAFSSVAAGRPIEAWFMASSRPCRLTERLAEMSNSYWLSNHNLKKRSDKAPLAKLLIRLLSLNTHTARLWFSYPVRKGWRVYPYMWLPFLFERLLRHDPHCRALWRETREISNAVPSGLKLSGLLKPLTERTKGEIDAKLSPLYKLDWRCDAARHEGSVLHYLLEETGVPPYRPETRSRAMPKGFKRYARRPESAGVAEGEAS